MQPQSEINSKCKFKTQQQQQQQLPTTPTIKNTTTRRTSILQQNPTTAAATAHEVTKLRSPAVKVVKCKKPLCHFKFYLDICDHQLTKRIEEQIKLLGGTQEFFLTASVTHFVTDKQITEATVATANSITNNSHNPNVSCPGTPQTPQTPQTPLTPYSVECLADPTKTNNGLVNKKLIRNSRADAILNKARRLSTINVSTPTTSNFQSKSLPAEKSYCSTPLKHKDYQGNNDTVTQPPPYVVWQCEIALRFFKKVQHELKDYLDQSNKSKIKCYAIEPISLKGGFIKFESLKRNYRPYYHLFRKPQEWPKIQLSREDGAFRLSPKKDLPLKEIEEIDRIPQNLDGGALVDIMTRKSRTKSSQNHHNNLKTKGNDLIKSPANSQKQLAKCKNQTPQLQKDSTDKQCGVCEICKIEYDALTIHLKTKDHEYFAKNSQNFMALDSLIHSSADVNKFLDENKKLEIKTELEEMEVEHESLIVIEQDPLQNSDNENQNDDDEDIDAEEDDDDEESQKSSSTTKRKSVEPKVFSPTLREKSKRSTKGKHSSEKFQNCTFTTTAKAPKTPSPQKHLGALDGKSTLTRKKPSSTVALSPPIRAMLPPNSMYKVVETHAEVNCTPPRGKGLVTGMNESKGVGSPSIIVKFKKVRSTELQVLNGEAENFMFPKKRRDSSELPTDIDRQTTSDRMQRTQSSQQIFTSSSSEEQDPDEDFGSKRKSLQMEHSGKKAIVKAKRRLSKVSSSSAPKSTLGGKTKQSFPKTPIQPNKQLKNETRPTTAITNTKKRKLAPAPQNHIAKIENVSSVVSAPNKIMLPEATRKSSRTATAIVTAATTSTRLLQAAVEAAKSKHKLERSIKSKLPLLAPLIKRIQIKQESRQDSEQEEYAENEDGSDVLEKTAKLKKLRCSRKSVVKKEDRMGDTIKKPRYYLNKSKFLHIFDADDYEDDDITLDEDCDDDEKDEDFIFEPSKGRTKLSSKLTKKSADNVSPVGIAVKNIPAAVTSISKSKRSSQTTLPNRSVREERLARRQSRLITQLQLELQTGSEEEHVKEFPKPRAPEKKTEKVTDGKLPSKSSLKLSKSETAAKKCSLKASPMKQESLQPSRYFDHTKSEHLKAMRYAFERLPATDLWYRVYKRQDNCEEKYFEYFGSTKYRKLPYELGPIPFDSTLHDNNQHKICCKLCVGDGLKADIENAQKLQVRKVRRDLQLDLKAEPSVSPNIKSLESQEPHICSPSSGHNKVQQQDQHNKDQEHSKLNCSSQATETKSYTHKHKKLHLLQRYRQELEQQELLQRQKLEEESKSAQTISGAMPNNSEIKMEDVTQDCLPSRNDRAGSIHSNASSCASSANANCKSKKARNKLLNKATFLANLELPPRKSPREHASTLALVSCIIKQRQDSLSKPNSETDEPAVKPPDRDCKVLPVAAEQLNVCELLAIEPPKTPPPSARKTSAQSPVPNVINSPRTRSQAATPVEELRFATEISETVKRMRRGRNKYDYSPPFVQRMAAAHSSTRARGKSAPNTAVNLFGGGKKFATSISSLGSFSQQKPSAVNTKLKPHATRKVVLKESIRRRGRQKKGYVNIAKNPENVLSSIRKTGSKKGVLEFDVDNIAIEALKKVTAHYVNPKLLEWQIDKFLTLANKEYGKDLLLPPLSVAAATEYNADDGSCVQSSNNMAPAIDDIVLNTPPATDYFSSDFDLCDIINQSCERLQGDHNGSHHDRKSKKFSIFNTGHLNKYYRKRKNPKTNRTGWPKAPKKKALTRQQSTQDKIYFLQNGKVVEENCENKIKFKNDVIDDNEAGDDDDETTQEQTRESGVITPPESENEIEDDAKHNKMIKNEEDDEEESLLMEDDSHTPPNESSQTPNEDDGEENCDAEDEDDIEECERPVEDETLADSVDDDDDDNYDDDDGDDIDDEQEEEEEEQKADSDADADIEEAEEDEERNTTRDNVLRKCMDLKKKVNRKCKKIVPKIIENDDEDSYEPQEKRLRAFQELPDEKLHINLLNPNSAHTSTLTTPFMRALRRTPQLNGSLGSCFSPSEKAGDNSDIFTVSSDGLDTDMDLSNSHSQLRSTTNIDIDEDDHHHYHHHYQLQHQHHNTSLLNYSSSMVSPRRKFDISKYAPTNAAICAAEAATAAVKSLAISQFLKKEVRVTCRRLRAPFRRFRYRR